MDSAKDTNVYDLIIVGGGPTGISCAIEAGKAGLDCLILEKGFLVNSIYHFPTNMTFFSTAQKIEIGEIPFIAHQDKPSRAEALEYYRRLVFHYDLKIKLGAQVESVAKDAVFNISTSQGSFKAHNVVLATGYYDIPVLIDVPGEKLTKVKHYYDDAHPYIQKDVVVVGGANSACDVALELWTKGAHVTMVVRDEELYKNVKYWILPNIQNRIKEGSITAYFNSNMTSIEDKQVHIKTPQGDICIPNDYVLAMTGYQIDYGFLAKCGVQFEPDEIESPVYSPDTLVSSIPGLYLAGVILSGRATSKLFIENTRHHGELIVKDILSKLKS